MVKYKILLLIKLFEGKDLVKLLYKHLKIKDGNKIVMLLDYFVKNIMLNFMKSLDLKLKE